MIVVILIIQYLINTQSFINAYLIISYPMQKHNTIQSLRMTSIIPSIQCQEQSVLISILSASAEISRFLRSSPTVKLNTSNDFGDQQLEQDVKCDFIIQRYLRGNNKIDGMASEQRPKYLSFDTEHKFNEQHYVVTYDPLDGSSIIDTNFAVGSIYSVWKNKDLKNSQPIIGKSLREQQNAILVIYGSRTTAILYNTSLNKVQQYTLIEQISHSKQNNDEWVLSKSECKISSTTKIFSPGNLRLASENTNFYSAVERWIKKGYTLRYSGGLAPDIYQIFIKGNGIFCCMVSNNFKVKLRLIYQVAAMAFLIQKAEGKCVACIMEKGSSENGINVMDVIVQGWDQRIGFVGGSVEEVDHLINTKCLEIL